MCEDTLVEFMKDAGDALKGAKVRVRQSIGHKSADAIGGFQQCDGLTGAACRQCRGYSRWGRAIDDDVASATRKEYRQEKQGEKKSLHANS